MSACIGICGMAEDADFVCEDLAVAHLANIFKSDACKCLSPTKPLEVTEQILKKFAPLPPWA
jgi:hypothetical protein